MNTVNDTRRYKSAYRYSSELGPAMGLLLFLMSACLIAGVHIPTLSICILPLGLCVPVLLTVLMRHIWIRAPHLRTFGAIWLAGIWIFIFGALICAILSAAWILLFEPRFVEIYIQECINAIENSPMVSSHGAELAQMHSLIEQGAIPSPLQFIFSMIWTTAFCGSILSLLCAAAIRARYTHKYPLTL